jgi:hypothetical protein
MGFCWFWIVTMGQKFNFLIKFFRLKLFYDFVLNSKYLSNYNCYFRCEQFWEIPTLWAYNFRIVRMKKSKIYHRFDYCLSEQNWRLCLSSNSDALRGGRFFLKFEQDNLVSISVWFRIFRPAVFRERKIEKIKRFFRIFSRWSTWTKFFMLRKL